MTLSKGNSCHVGLTVSSNTNRLSGRTPLGVKSVTPADEKLNSRHFKS